MHIGRVFHHAAEGSVEGELDFANDDGGIATQDVPSPRRLFPEAPLLWRVGLILVVEHLGQEHEG